MPARGTDERPSVLTTDRSDGSTGTAPGSEKCGASREPWRRDRFFTTTDRKARTRPWTGDAARHRRARASRPRPNSNPGRPSPHQLDHRLPPSWCNVNSHLCTQNLFRRRRFGDASTTRLATRPTEFLHSNRSPHARAAHHPNILRPIGDWSTMSFPAASPQRGVLELQDGSRDHRELRSPLLSTTVVMSGAEVTARL